MSIFDIFKPASNSGYVSPILTQGCDISSWQNDPTTPATINFVKMAAAGMKFIYIRSTVGDTNDKDFVSNWQAAKAAGLLRGAYHMHYFNQSLSQCQRFINRLVDDPGELPPAFDLERGGFGVAVPTVNKERLKNALEYFDAEFAKWAGIKWKPTMVIYTNPDIIINYFGDNLPAWFLKHPLWIASYSTKPNIGQQYKFCYFWQNTNKMDGLKYGVESKQLDSTLYNGDYNALRSFAGLDAVPEVPKTLEERVKFLEDWAKTQGFLG